MKNSLCWFNRRSNTAEESVSELEDRMTEPTETEAYTGARKAGGETSKAPVTAGTLSRVPEAWKESDRIRAEIVEDKKAEIFHI